MTESTSSQTRVLVIIPARSGSKGIRKKNIVELGGVPLLAWSIRVALASKYVSRVVVSTDSEEFAEVARMYGADVPFLRPATIAGDLALVSDAVTHAEEQIAALGEHYDISMTLFPSHPFRTPELIDRLVAAAVCQAFAVRTVKETFYSHEPFVLGSGFEQVELVSSLQHGLMNQDLSLAIAHSKPAPELKTLHGVDFTIFGLRQIRDGDERYVRRLHVFPIREQAMLVDIDTEDDLHYARELVAARRVPWHPVEGLLKEYRPEIRRRMSARSCLTVFRYRGDWEAVGDLEYDSVDWSQPAHLRSIVERQFSSTRGCPILISRNPQPDASSDAGNAWVDIDHERVFQVGARKAYAEKGFSRVLMDEQLQAEFGPFVGSLRVRNEGAASIVELPDEPQVGDYFQVDLTCHDSGPTGKRTFCSGFYRYDGTSWKFFRKIIGQRSDEFLELLSLDSRHVKFAWQDQAVLAFAWWLEAEANDDLPTVLEPIEIPGVIRFDAPSSAWFNERTGEKIIGRQQWPSLRFWGGNAFLPAELSRAAQWFVRSSE